MSQFKPMLAVDAKDIRYPVFASYKIDGVRAAKKDGSLLSRSLKPIPNAFVQDVLAARELDGLDGELTVGPPNAHNVIQATTSGVMSKDGEPDFTWWVFDFWTAPTMPFGERYQIMNRAHKDGVFEGQTRVMFLEQHLIQNEAELLLFEGHALQAGYEGIMIRDPKGLYKYGRSTAREGHLLKVKRFTDSEAVVIGFEERMHNANEAKVNALGYTERSSHQANLVPMGTLGALLVRDVKTEVEFAIGTGFDDRLRELIWINRPTITGQIVTYKHFAAAGVKDKPRFPVFKGFRNERDMS